MKDGFIKCAAGTVDVRVADVDYNKQQILLRVKEAADAGVHLLILPELCLSGYTCGDLFFTDTLLEACRDALSVIATETKQPSGGFRLGLSSALPREVIQLRRGLSPGKNSGSRAQDRSSQLQGVL